MDFVGMTLSAGGATEFSESFAPLGLEFKIDTSHGLTPVATFFPPLRGSFGTEVVYDRRVVQSPLVKADE